MWCLVSLPNSLVLEIELDAKALGQDCLNKVCQHMGVVETDFFGLLQVPSANTLNGETGYWLNLRNGLLRQLSGSAPYRLQLKVKFYVEPHYMLHANTRSIVLKSLKSLIKDEYLSCSEEELITFLGLLAQAELGSFEKSMVPVFKEAYTQYLPSDKCTDETVKKIILEHKKHKGITSDRAVYKALQEAVNWTGYGVEWHSVKRAHSPMPITIGVGPKSVELIDQQTGDVKSIPYGAVQKATHAGKCFYLHTLTDDGATFTETFKLPTQKASNALYRCVTEMYLFYFCDTVRNDVASQFDRDIKGTLVSLFSENKELGKKYVFDIQRTLQETYDYNRRKLFVQENMPPALPAECSGSDLNLDGSPEALCSDGESVLSEDECSDSTTLQCNKFNKSSANSLSEWLLCKVCMDANINTVFCPCGHVTCCEDCANKLDSCPLCREPITNLQVIFLPSITVKSLKSVDVGS